MILKKQNKKKNEKRINRQKENRQKVCNKAQTNSLIYTDDI